MTKIRMLVGKPISGRFVSCSRGVSTYSFHQRLWDTRSKLRGESLEHDMIEIAKDFSKARDFELGHVRRDRAIS